MVSRTVTLKLPFEVLPAPSVAEQSTSVFAIGNVDPEAGTQVGVTTETASQEAKGQTKSLERWAEFMKGGKVAGREVVTIVPQSDISKVQKDTPPRPNSSKVETLKGGDYVRVWINKGGNHYLMHLPMA